MLGYMAGTLRFEVEYLNRYLGDAMSPIGGTTSAAIEGKSTE